MRHPRPAELWVGFLKHVFTCAAVVIICVIEPLLPAVAMGFCAGLVWRGDRGGQ